MLSYQGEKESFISRDVCCNIVHYMHLVSIVSMQVLNSFYLTMFSNSISKATISLPFSLKLKFQKMIHTDHGSEVKLHTERNYHKYCSLNIQSVFSLQKSILSAWGLTRIICIKHTIVLQLMIYTLFNTVSITCFMMFLCEISLYLFRYHISVYVLTHECPTLMLCLAIS